ncbi:hypothetical protein XELAEV_18019061mg [Xenopus laevis]|uniref:Uncharacterized protein n=2 Tax=Xenopus laevis TaxID=8355 RepID=A0A974DGV9_XENLA|nr:interferon-like LOC124629383 [Xenopus laevis]ANQ43331.1 type I interferon 19 [Xenopus laevis]OCT90447.1 hypothetical protein XELAEV_18019061mg [Xenopus laevis]
MPARMRGLMSAGMCELPSAHMRRSTKQCAYAQNSKKMGREGTGHGVDDRAELIDHKIQKAFDHFPPNKNHEDDCLLEIPDNLFPKNRSQAEVAAMVSIVHRRTMKDLHRFRLPVEKHNELRLLLQKQINQLAPCIKGKAQYKEATELIYKQYKEISKKVREWESTECTETINWAFNNILQQAVQRLLK